VLVSRSTGEMKWKTMSDIDSYKILKYYQVMLEKTEKYLLSNRNISVKDYKGAKFRIRSYKKSIQEIKDRISLINKYK